MYTESLTRHSVTPRRNKRDNIIYLLLWSVRTDNAVKSNQRYADVIVSNVHSFFMFKYHPLRTTWINLHSILKGVWNLATWVSTFLLHMNMPTPTPLQAPICSQGCLNLPTCTWISALLLYVKKHTLILLYICDDLKKGQKVFRSSAGGSSQPLINQGPHGSISIVYFCKIPSPLSLSTPSLPRYRRR